MREKSPNNDPGPQVDLQALVLTITVSLFTALLAFLIVLNSFSSDNPERRAGLVQSLNASFGFLPGQLSSDLLELSGSGKADRAEADASTMLRAVLPDFDFKSGQGPDGGRSITASLAPDALADQWSVLSTRIADLMSGPFRGRGYMLHIVALNGRNSRVDLVQYAQDLEAAGVDAGVLSVGYEDRGRRLIELRFVGGRR